MSKQPKLNPALAQRVKAGVEHFEMTMGHLPIQMKTMSERMPQVFAGYMDIRTWLMRDPPDGAMPRKYKHLIFTLLDCIYGNDKGAENHARAALRRGLSVDEFLEGMVQILIVGGIGVYGQTGYKVLDNVLASDEAKAAMKKAKGDAKAVPSAASKSGAKKAKRK
jgi:alkylhydroperoxidase/carboxymuconolactone decarboxylase family protein YurZ